MTILLFTIPACRPGVNSVPGGAGDPTPSPAILSQRTYQVHQRLELVNTGDGQPEKQNLWVALIQSLPPYQEVLSMSTTPEVYTLVVDEYGNRYAEFDLSDHPPGSVRSVEIDYLVVVEELAWDMASCEGEMLKTHIQPELHIESANPQIVTLADELSQGQATACQQARAFYDYTGNELVYSYNRANWGAQAALGHMGADCTEYAGLFVALSRAEGIPARYFEGLLYLDEDTRSIARLEHAWADVYLPGAGWVAVDPTLGRSSLKREEYFARYTPDHIIVTQGASPSTLRGGSYWTHLYWPGNSTKISVTNEWEIKRMFNQ